ncbi:hypothetical protein CH302_28355 [Rhodococcus sp. 15-2388-1-1a]|uniref:hypothetical protein n=1 Tax=Rhodococcus sp. 15-2388-1-1a TaxID=2023142 RepID=UPI000B9BF27F|nr:hypothetical protein [Rhodococcus sp. 15-2388-1-1a]OZE89295.1 hypothetical protein CH302_28355 [Rhodococcus sp. 15-2388-1-1a]
MQPAVIGSLISGFVALLTTAAIIYSNYIISVRNRENIRETLSKEVTVWEKLPDGKEKEDLLKVINEQARKLIDTDRSEPASVAQRAAVIGMVVAVLAGAIAYGVLRVAAPLQSNYTILGSVHPDMPTTSKLKQSFALALENTYLSQRGAMTFPNCGAAVHVLDGSGLPAEMTVCLRYADEACQKENANEVGSDSKVVNFDIVITPSADRVDSSPLVASRAIEVDQFYTAEQYTAVHNPLRVVIPCDEPEEDTDVRINRTFTIAVLKSQVYLGMQDPWFPIEWKLPY